VVDTKWQEMKETLQEQTSIDLSKLSTTKSDMKLYGTSSAYLLVLRPYSDLNKAVDIDATNDDTSTSTSTSTSGAEENASGSQPSQALPKRVLPNKSTSMSHIPPKSIVYGINPVSEFGVAKRQVTSKENGLTCTSTTVKLGFLEIHMASLEEVTEVDASTMTSNDKRSSDDSHDDNKSDEGIMTQPKPMALFTMPTMQQMQRLWKEVRYGIGKNTASRVSKCHAHQE